MNASLTKGLIANLSTLRRRIDSRPVKQSENQTQDYNLHQLSLATIAVSVTSACPLTKAVENHIESGNFQSVYILPNAMYIRQSERPFSPFHDDAALHEEVQPYHRH